MQKIAWIMVLVVGAVSAADYEATRKTFLDGTSLDPSYRGQSYSGKVLCGDGSAEELLIVGPAVQAMPVAALAGGRVLMILPADVESDARGTRWADPGGRRELRRLGESLILETKSPEGDKTCYGAFQRQAPSSALLASLEKTDNPFTPERSAPGVVVGGEFFAGLGSGQTPVHKFGTTKPYEGSVAGVELWRKWRGAESALFEGFDFTVKPSYLGANGAPSKGRFNFEARADAWINDKVALQLGHITARDVGGKDESSSNQTAQRTWVGLRYVPTGMDNKKDHLEFYLDLSRVPGHLGKGYDHVQMIGPNNWPVRIRGEGPAEGWRAGMDLSRVVVSSIKLPFVDTTLRDVAVFAGVALMGGTPFDDPESVWAQAGLETWISKGVKAQFGVEMTSDLNKAPVVDPDARSAESLVSTMFGKFIIPF